MDPIHILIIVNTLSCYFAILWAERKHLSGLAPSNDVMPFSLLSYHWEKNPISNKIFRILLAKIPLKWKSEIGQSTGDRDFKRESSPVLAFYKVFEPAPNKREPLHCRLRRSIGFLNVQKQMVVSHSRNSKI